MRVGDEFPDDADPPPPRCPCAGSGWVRYDTTKPGGPVLSAAYYDRFHAWQKRYLRGDRSDPRPIPTEDEMIGEWRYTAAARCLCPAGRVHDAQVPYISEVVTAEEMTDLFPLGPPPLTVGGMSVSMLDAIGLPKKMRGWTLQSFPDQKLRQLVAMKAWVARDDRPDLVLHGMTGTGKTGLAVGGIRALAARGLRVLFRDATEWITILQSTFRQQGASEWTELQPFLTCHVLVLDDLDARRITDHYLDTLRLVVNGRQKENLTTILTMNLTTEELATVLDPTLLDRLRESAEFWTFEGRSRRKNVVEFKQAKMALDIERAQPRRLVDDDGIESE